MQITGLPQSGAFTGTDVLAIEINGVTYKLDGATLATAIASIGSLVTGIKGNNEGTYRTGNVNITPANIGAYSQADTDSAIQQSTADKAYKVVLSSSEHDTWAKVYAVLSELPSYETGTLFSGPTASSALTDGKITTSVAGIITRSGTSIYAIVSSGLTPYCVYVSNMTASSRTTIVLRLGYASVDIKPYITRSDGSADTIGRAAYAGNTVTVELQMGGVALSAGENTVATLSKFYPTWTGSTAGFPNACGFIGAGTAVGTPVRCLIDGVGNLKVYAPSAITSTLRVTFTYNTGNDALIT